MAVGTPDLRFRVLAQVVGQQALEALKGTLDGIDKSSKTLSNGLKSLATYFAAEKIISFGKGILENADNLNKMSQKTGVAVETLAKFQGAAELSNVPLEGLAKGLNKLAVNMVEAKNGNSELSGTFKSLGIGLRDSSGNMKTAGDVTKELADKFKGFKDGPEKAALAVKLFGKSGADLIPFLNQGSEEIEKFGLAIDQDFASRAEKFLDTLTLIGMNIKNGAISSLQALLPTLQEIADAFTDFTSSGDDTIGFMDALSEAGRLLAIGLVASFTGIKSALDAAITGFREAWALLKGDSKEVERLDRELGERMQRRLADMNAFTLKLTKNSLLFGEGTEDEIRKRRQTETETRRPGTGTVPTDALGENAKVLKTLDEKIAKLKAEASAIGQSNVEKQSAILIAELESKGISKSSRAYAEYTVKIREAVTALQAAKEKEKADDFTRKQEQEIELQRLQIKNYALSEAELQKLVIAKELDNQATEATKDFTDEGREAYMKATEAVKEHRLALVDLQEQQKQSFTVGAQQAFRDYLESARNVAQQTREMFSHAFANMEDALVDFVKTGRLNFAKFADDVITDLIRIQIRAIMVQAITGGASLFGSLFSSGASAGATTAGEAAADPSVAYAANGGIMTSKGMVPLRRYARGGVATSPQLAVFGEGSRPEAYVPLPDGRSIPVSMKGGAGDTNVSVVVNMDGGGDSQKADSEKGAQLGRLIAAAVKSEILNQKRPGGVLA